MTRHSLPMAVVGLVTAAAMQAGTVVLDTFTGPPTSVALFEVGSVRDQQPTDQGYIRELTAAITRVDAPGTVRLAATVGLLAQFRGELGLGVSSGYFVLKYGDFNNPAHPELNLNRSAYGQAGGLGLFLRDLVSHQPVPFKMTIYSGTNTNGWRYEATLPAALAGDYSVDGNAFTAFGSPDLSDIDSVTFEFDPPPGDEFSLRAVGLYGRSDPTSIALTISHVGSKVVVSWPAWATSFTLRSGPEVNQAWIPVGSAPRTNGPNLTVTFPLVNPRQFFR